MKYSEIINIALEHLKKNKSFTDFVSFFEEENVTEEMVDNLYNLYWLEAERIMKEENDYQEFLTDNK